MIKNDYTSFPEFRESFFTLVEKMVKNCTSGLFSLDWSKFQTIIMTILFAIKHEKPEAMEIGLNTMNALNQLVAVEPMVTGVFYKNFYVIILKDLIMTMTDYRHMSGFKL